MIQTLRRRLADVLAQPFRTAGRENRRVLHSLLRDASGAILELGPGGAPLLARLGGVDAAQKYVIEYEGAVAKSRELGFRCLLQDLGQDRWDLPDESIDVVVSNQVLEHIPRTDHVMRESLRVLRPGGRFIVSVPNPGALAYVLMMLLTLTPPMNMVSDEYYGLGNPLSARRFRRSAEFGTEGHGHLRLFTVRAMQDLLLVHGFRPIRAHGGTWGVPFVGKFLARVMPWYGLYTIVVGEKLPRRQG